MCYLERDSHYVPEGNAFNPTLVEGEGTCSPRWVETYASPLFAPCYPCLGGPGEERALLEYCK